MASALSAAHCCAVTSTARSTRLTVLLIGLPGLYESLLRREYRPDTNVSVVRIAQDARAEMLPRDVDAVIVVGSDAASLRRATELLGGSARVLGVVAVTDDEPRGDAYLVAPVGLNVTPRELAQVIREIASAERIGSGPQTPHTISRGLTRSER